MPLTEWLINNGRYHFLTFCQVSDTLCIYQPFFVQEVKTCPAAAQLGSGGTKMRTQFFSLKSVPFTLCYGSAPAKKQVVIKFIGNWVSLTPAIILVMDTWNNGGCRGRDYREGRKVWKRRKYLLLMSSHPTTFFSKWP